MAILCFKRKLLHFLSLLICLQSVDIERGGPNKLKMRRTNDQASLCCVCSSGIPGKVVQDAVTEVIADFNSYSRLSFEGRERISR